jgi:CRP/FNR family cyclic AMP-dependent transcriptional regulator
MINRFEGTEGKRLLVEALKASQLVEHNEMLANKLIEVGQLVSFKTGDVVMTQGGTDNDIYFILFGQVNVVINNRQVAIREAREAVGEMALLNPTEPRSATVTARSADVVTFKITEPDFRRIADESPHLWRTVAQIEAERLRQRSVFLNAPNPNPRLFLGCSAESLVIAQEIQLGFKHDKINALIWTDGVFGPSSVAIDALLTEVNESDFAVFVFSPDDKVISRDNQYDAPRDNTIFELGLFMGRLERNRTFIVKEHSSDVKIPTDLLGITPLTYVYRDGDNLTAAINTICTQLRKEIEKLGAR